LGFILFSEISAYVYFYGICSWRVLFRYYSIAGLVLAALYFPLSYFENQKVDLQITSDSTQQHTETSQLIHRNNPDDEKTNNKTIWEICSTELWSDKSHFRLFVSNFIPYMGLNIPVKFSMIVLSSCSDSTDMIYFYMPICVGLAHVLSMLCFTYLYHIMEGTLDAFFWNKLVQISELIVFVCVYVYVCA
jgi:hypothetical protein